MDKKKAMIQLLLDSDCPMSVVDIASKIDVSGKTIRNYLQELNYGNKVLMVEKIGTRYYLTQSAKIYFKEHLHSDDQLVLTNEEREKYILNRLLTTKTNVKTFELADELYISFSSFRNSISQINKRIEKYNLKIVSRNNELFFEGHQSNRQQLFAELIHNEAINSLYSIDQLIKYFDPTYVNNVKKIIDEYIITEKLVVNEISHLNILVHFLIILDFTNESYEPYSKNANHERNEEGLSGLISKYLLFEPSESDQKKLLDIISMNSKKEISNLETSDELKKFTHDLIQKVEKSYSINLFSEAFYNYLLLHLKNLIIRKNQGKYARNPLKNTIAKKSPAIFDIATSCAIIICNHYNWVCMAEDEIAYLALHIGMQLNKYSGNSNKIRTIISIPSFTHLKQDFFKKIESRFEDDLIVIKENATQFYDKASVELVITCQTIDSHPSEVATVSPFLTIEDMNTISQSIDKIYHQRSLSRLRIEFNKFFSKDFFHIYETENIPKNKYDIIKFLCLELIDSKIICKNYMEKILEREKMASTAFKHIAIPHQFTYSAKKSVISVIISKDGIDWSGKKINLLLLACMSDKDRKKFNQFYEILLEAFSNELFLVKLSSILSFQDFKALIGVK